MREIKFRFWNRKTKQMASWDDMENGTSSRLCSEFEDIRNEENEIMQYTGLKDKNGKEIYEGDILNSVHKNQHGTFNKIVSVKENEFYVGNGEYDEETIVGGWLIETEDFFHELDSFEIIGNIYENPELLK